MYEGSQLFSVILFTSECHLTDIRLSKHFEMKRKACTTKQFPFHAIVVPFSRVQESSIITARNEVDVFVTLSLV